MAELSSVLAALRNADAAGDVPAAQRLAQIAQSMANTPATPNAAPVAPPTTPPAAAPTAPAEDQSFMRSVADVPLGLGSGLVSGVRTAADFFGAGSDISKSLKNTETYIDSLMSAQSKQDSQEMARILQEAEGKGLGTQLRAGLRALSVAPVDVLSRSFGAMAPIVAATAATVLSGGTALAAGAVGAGLSAVSGAGLIKGDIYDAIKTDPTLKAKLSPEKLEEVAQQAQAYNGENLDQILLGAGLYSLESLAGVPKQLTNLTTRILTKAGAKQAAGAAAERTVEQGVEELAKQAGKKILPAAAKAAGAGAGTEFLQEGQEQLAENLALQREGVDVSALKGVIPRATLGAGMGAIAGGVGAGVDTKLARDKAAATLRQVTGETQEDFDELAAAADSVGDAELAAHFRERAQQDRADVEREAPPTDVPPVSDEQAAQDQGVATRATSAAPAPAPVPQSEPEARKERPIAYDLPTYTPEDLELLAVQAEASGNDEEADTYRNEADQLRISQKERAKPAAPVRLAAPTPAPVRPAAPAPAPVQPAPTPTAEETRGQAQTIEAKTQERQVGPETSEAPTTGEPAATVASAAAEERVTPAAEPVAETKEAAKPVAEIKEAVEPAPAEITKDVLLKAGVNNAALRTKNMGIALNRNAPVVERVAALREYARNPNITSEVKANVTALADSFEVKPAPKGLTAKGGERKRAPGAGRPAQELTPEQKEEKEKLRAFDKAEREKAVRRVSGTAAEAIETPINNLINAATDDLIAKAEKTGKRKLSMAERRAIASGVAKTTVLESRVEHLADAYRVLKRDPKARNKPAQLAKALIEHSSVTAEERTQAQAKAKADPTVRSDIGTEAAVDPTYAGFTTADQAITHVLNTGTKFQRALAARLKPLLKGVKVVLVQKIDDVPAGEIRDRFTEGTNAAGLYSDSNRTIYINGMEGQSGTDAYTVLHESLHAATLRLIVAWMSDPAILSPKQRQLVKQLGDIMSAAEERLSQRRVLGLLTQEELELYRVGAFTDLREFITYGLTNEAMQKFLLKTDGTFVESSAPLEMLANLLSRFVQTIRKLFGMDEEHSSAFQDLVILTEEMLSAANMKLPPVAISAAAKINREAKNLNRQAASDRATELPGVITRMAKAFRGSERPIAELRRAYSTMGTKAIRGAVQALDTRDLVRWVGDKLPALKRISKGVEAMNAWRNTQLRLVSEKTEGWVKFAKRNPPAQRALGTVMQISTLVGVDPTLHPDVNAALSNDARLKELQAQEKDPQLSVGQRAAIARQIAARQSDIKLVYKLWDKLGALDPTGAGKKLYADIKKEYERTYDMQMEELRLKVERSKDIEGDADDTATPKGRLIADIVRSFQEAKKLGVYFPLVRYGNYWLRVGKKGSKNSEFYMLESEFARDALADVIAKERGTTREQMLESTDMDLGNDPQQLRRLIETDSSSQMLKDIYKALDARSAAAQPTQQTLSSEEAKAQADAAMQDIKDTVYRMYLHTLPERDMRKRFLKRQGRTGYNTDVIRNFVTTQHSAVNQLTRLKFAESIRLEVSAARDSLEGNADKAKLGEFVEEMSKRVDLELTTPDPNNLFARLSSLGAKATFYYMMTAPKSALVQITQLPAIGLPVLAAKYGWAKTTALIPKYLNLYKTLSTTRTSADGEVITEWGQPSLQNASYIKEIKDPEYREVMTKAWNMINNAGGFTVTFTSELTERGNKPTSSFDWKESPASSALRFTLDFMSGALHHTERLTREVMGMSAFELAYADAKQKGASSETALNTAVEAALNLIPEGLFDYSEFNKPRLLRYPAAKLPAQFLTFPVQITSYLIRNFWGVLKHLFSNTKELFGGSPIAGAKAAAAATQMFFTTLAMTFAFGGVTAFPMYSMFMGMIDMYRELMRKEMEDDPEKYAQYDAADPRNPWGKRSYDLYFRDTVIPSLFGNGSSVANYLGLTEAQAQTLARGFELGPISAFTDMNIGASTSLDNMWFRDEAPAESNRAAFETLALKFFGPFGSMGTQIAGALDDFENGDISRGAEKLTPAFFRGALASVRLSEEGAQTPGKDAQILDAEFYTVGKLLTRTLGFQSTTEAEIQKSSIMAKRLVEEVEAERTKLVDSAGKAVVEMSKDPTDVGAKKEFDKQIQEIVKFNLRNPFAMVDGDTLNSSITTKAENRERASMLQGVMVSEAMTGVVMPMIESSRTAGKK